MIVCWHRYDDRELVYCKIQQKEIQLHSKQCDEMRKKREKMLCEYKFLLFGEVVVLYNV